MEPSKCLYGVGIMIIYIKTGKYSLTRDSHWVTSQEVHVAGGERAVRVATMTGSPQKGHSIQLN